MKKNAIKVEMKSKWLDVWEKETDKAVNKLPHGILPTISKWMDDHEAAMKAHKDVADAMKPFLQAAKELGEDKIVADIEEQLAFNLNEAKSLLKIIVALKKAYDTIG